MQKNLFAVIRFFSDDVAKKAMNDENEKENNKFICRLATRQETNEFRRLSRKQSKSLHKFDFVVSKKIEKVIDREIIEIMEDHIIRMLKIIIDVVEVEVEVEVEVVVEEEEEEEEDGIEVDLEGEDTEVVAEVGIFIIKDISIKILDNTMKTMMGQSEFWERMKRFSYQHCCVSIMDFSFVQLPEISMTAKYSSQKESYFSRLRQFFSTII